MPQSGAKAPHSRLYPAQSRSVWRWLAFCCNPPVAFFRAIVHSFGFLRRCTFVGLQILPMQNPSPLPSWSGPSRWLRGVLGLVTLVSATVSTASAAIVTISLQQVERGKTGTNTGQLGAIDLTDGGLALDWLKCSDTLLTFAQKDQATLLTFSPLGTPSNGKYSDDGYSYTWSGGAAPNASGSNVLGLNDNSSIAGRGYRLNFVAPAAGDYVVKYYSAANQQTGNLGIYQLAGFIDGAPDDVVHPGTNIGADSVDELVWTIQITADTAGQSFNMDFTRSSAAAGALAVTAATVSAVTVPEPMSAGLLLLGAVVVGGKRRRR